MCIRDSLILAAVLLPLAFLSKYFSSKMVFKKLRGGESISKFVGIIFNFRLTFGIVSALFGLKAGIINIETYTAIIIVIIASALISSIITRKTEETIQ